MVRRSRRRGIVAALAGALVLAAGGLALPAFAETSGSIAGRFLDDGEPVTSASVRLYDTNFGFVASTSVDSTGAFQFTDLIAGTYKLQFFIGAFEQWSSQKASFDAADPITVVDGQTTMIEEVVRPHGSISGQVSNADGTPAAFASVQALPDSGARPGFASTDAQGNYTISYLIPGDYRVSFRKDFDSPVQYANNAASFPAADLIPVTAGATTTLDQTFLPFATVTGTVTTAQGQPAAFVSVTFEATTPGSAGGSAFTDGDGRYQALLWPGTYTVSINRDGLTQYLPGQVDAAQAQQYTFGAGTTVLDEQLLPTGTVEGTVTHSDGTPVAFTSVTLTSGSMMRSGSTDFQGRYTVEAYPGTYRVAFLTEYGTQWENGRSSAAAADSVSVAAGATVTVDEVLAPFGSVSITAVDSLTGAPVSSFCVNADFGQGCTDTGTVTDTDALPGQYTVSFSSQGDGTYLPTSDVVDVVSGQTTSLVISAVPGATVTTTMTDRRTGAPVANACLELVGLTEPSRLGLSKNACSDATGAVTVSRLEPGAYKAFVWARDGVHGHQWVGNHHGVGQFKHAITIDVAAGETVTVAPVWLDAKGSITGTVTDEITGEPVTNGSVALSSYVFGFGEAQSQVPIDGQGRYTLPDLGPYQWHLLFSAPGSDYAAEWAGDEAERDRSAHIKVKEDRVTTYDTALGVGTTVAGQVFGPDGTLATSARISFYNADSGDAIAFGDLFLPQGPEYVAHVKGPQPVKVSYGGRAGGQFYNGWIGGSSFLDATVFTIPAGGEFTLDVTLS